MQCSSDLYIDGWSTLVVSNLLKTTKVTFEKLSLVPMARALGAFLLGFSTRIRSLGHRDTMFLLVQIYMSVP